MKKRNLKKFAREVSIPFVLLLLYFFFFHFQRFFPVPSQDTFLDLILNYVDSQSLWIIFLIAFLEGGLILGQYAPGGIIIFMSILSAAGDITKIAILVSIISIAFIIAYCIDYLIGYYGLHLLLEKFGLGRFMNRSKKLLEKNVSSTIFFSYWDTNLASITATASGILKIPFKKFFLNSLFSTIFWNIFWAVILVTFGTLALRLFGPQYLLILIVVWILVIIYRSFIKKEEAMTANF